MNLFKPGRSLPGLFFFYFLIALGLITAVVSYSIASNAKQQIAAMDEGIRTRYVESQRTLVASEVGRIGIRAEELRKRGAEKAKEDLEERLSVASALLEKKGIDRSILSSLEYRPRGVRFFAISGKGTISYAGDDAELEGHPYSALSDRYPVLAGFFDSLFAEGSAFGSFGSGPQGLLILGGKNAATGAYLCVSVSTEVMSNYIKTQLLEALQKERFGESGYGYFFVTDENFRMIGHGLDPSLVGKNLKDIPAADGVDLRGLFSQALANSDGEFVKYQWIPPKSSVSQEKTSYLMRLKPWNWIVGAGFYFSDFDQNIRQESLAAAKEISRSTNAQLAALAIAVLVSIIIGSYLVFRVGRLEREDARHFNELTRYKLLLDESALVSKTDPDGIITYVNDRFCEATGYTREQAVGKPQNIERHPSTPKELFREMWETIKAGRTWHGIIKNKRADGSSYYKQATILPVCGDKGEPIEYIAAAQDITELIEQRVRLERVFHTDPLTGLGSRIKLLEDIERTTSPSVALMDIVDFGRINDSYGEARGDELLKECGARLSDAANRTGYSLFRMYADTFALLAEAPDVFSFIKDLKSIRESVISAPFQIGTDTMPLDLRIGVASGDKDVFAYADLALGAARARNLEIYYYGTGDETLSQDLTRSVDALRNIHAALRNDRVYPVFQPIADAATGKIEKYECLLRASAENGEEMAPGDFIPVSKKTRIYPALTRSIIEQSIRAFARTDYEFSVNLTLEDLFNASTIDLLTVGARDAELSKRLVVEIVETEELVGYEEAISALRRFKKEGIKIAIDDFGTGYSNFNYLLKLDPDYVKIDGSIISRIVDDPRAEGLARSIVAFARDSGIKTIAEYVSTPEIAKTATSLGIDYLQGYWIGKPSREL